MLEMSCLIDDPDCPKAGKHRELERAEIKKSEDAVQCTIAAIHGKVGNILKTQKERKKCLALIVFSFWHC